MESDRFFEGFFKFTSGVTRLFPKTGAKAMDGLFYPLLGNRILVDFFRDRNHRKLKRLSDFQRILVISDIHIGDAVLAQTAVSALRDFFPKARIDYMIKKSVACLLEGHPDVSTLLPIFTGGQFPNEQDILSVQEISSDYDAVFNFCPFIKTTQFPEPEKVFNVMTQVAAFARNEWKGNAINHITFQAHQFIYDILQPSIPLQRTRTFEGPSLFLSPGAIDEARAFREKFGQGEERVVFLNPETASPFTQIPFRHQAELLYQLVEMPVRIWLGESRADRGLTEKLLFTLPLWKRDRVNFVPAQFSLDAYAALIDGSDVFISGDTGPLHLAAAWKRGRDGKHVFRNRTTVLGVFGATPPRLSGYDSSRWDYLEGEQKAWAHVFQSESSCRNITCMHKMAKVCDAEGCFKSLDVEAILSDIRKRLLLTA